jgi:NodT family efflux transporter outer membrane factor (OMF) lipoprotein
MDKPQTSVQCMSGTPWKCFEKAALVAVLAATASACTVGPDFERPKAPATDAYTNEGGPQLSPADAAEVEQHVSTEKKVTPDWWTQFGSPDLDRTIATAIEQNRTLAATKATLAQAEQAVVAAYGPLYPQVDFSASAVRQQINTQSFGIKNFPAEPPFNLFTAGPSVSYTVDLFGGVKRQIEGQEALAEYEAYQLDAAMLALTGNVTTQVFTIASAGAQISAVHEILADDETNVSLVRTAREAGSVSEVDVLIARSQLENDRTLLPPLRQQLSVARHALAILVGQPPAEWSAPKFDLDRFTLPRELPLSLPSELVHDRPDIMAAEAQLHAASATIGVATANLYPQITLSGSVGQQALTLGHFFEAGSNIWSLAGGLTAPIFHGGTLEAERQGAIDAYRASLANYEQTVLTSFGQVADVLQALTHDAEELVAQRHALEAADASLSLTRLSYSAGNVGVIQVLDAQRLHEQARLGYVRAEAQRFQDTAQLYLALGGARLSAKAE